MSDNEKIVAKLQDAAAYFRSSFDAMYGTVACEKFRSWTDAIEQALALLKAQEPRVMTLEEALGAEVNVDQCWLEVNGVARMYLADAVVCPERLERAYIQRWGAPACQLPLDLYGEYWRMWTAKPTNAQREAEPWLT